MPLSPRATRARGVLAVGLVLGTACAGTLRTEEHPALRERAVPVAVLAVAPFRPAATLAPDAAGRSLAATLVARYVTEALEQRGVRVIAPADLGHALGLAAPPATPLDPRAVAARAHAEFGADTVLLGAVLRFRKRSGEALGTTEPASVAFEVRLHAAPSGEPLWGASFDETQEPLFANLLNLRRYPGGGTRWLTAEELARWGAREVAEALPRGPAVASP